MQNAGLGRDSQPHGYLFRALDPDFAFLWSASARIFAMPFKPDSQLEPIPGYKLIERLGGGGFGEVWKCEVPGGLFKAIKFVFGNLEDIGAMDDSVRAEQELRSLERIKKIRHPFILTLERYEIIDGQLMIVTELADCSLYDRFRDYRNKGAMGVPRDELLGYLAETAEALDVMTREHDLLHLDIKPQNLFLIYNHIKIGDFGLVKDLEGVNANVTGGVTPVYAAPETFEGYVSRFSDQYSLAIVYQELLTGVRPFAGTNTKQLMLQHIQGKPNLDPLPPEDRPVVAQALAKKPVERWETCTAFVTALRQAGKTKPTADAPTDSNPDLGAAPPLEAKATAASFPVAAHAKTIANKVENDYFELGPAAAGKGSKSFQRVSSNAATQARRQPATGRQPVDNEQGVLRPTVLIGLGQFGRATLQWIRQGLQNQYGPTGLPMFRFLMVDTDPLAPNAELVVDSRQQASANISDDLLLARLNRPTRYIRAKDNLPPVEPWLDTNILYRMTRNMATNGIRALGRLAFIEHYNTFITRLERDLLAVQDGSAIEESTRLSKLPLANIQPRVCIVTHLGGGTGSGMFIDCAYIVRQTLRKLGAYRTDVGGLFFIPNAECLASPDLAEANAVAALYELFHYQEAKELFQTVYEAKAPASEERAPPFSYCFYFETPRRLKVSDSQPLGDSARRIVRRAADCFTELMTTTLGRAANPAILAEGRSAHQAAGIRILASPRRMMIRQSAKILVTQLLEAWLKPLSPDLLEVVRRRIDGYLHYEKLDPEAMYRHFEQSLCGALQKPVDALLDELIAPFQKTIQEGLPDVKAVKRGMREIIKTLGTSAASGSETMTTEHPDTKLTRALRDVSESIVRNGGKRLVFAIFRHLDKAGLRFGATEEALRYVLSTLDGWAAHHDARAKQAQLEFAQAVEYLRNDVNEYERLKNVPKWRWPSMSTPAERLMAIFRARYRAMMHDRMAVVYSRFRGMCQEQSSNLSLCRSRVQDMAKNILQKEDAVSSFHLAADGKSPSVLMPPGYQDIVQVSQTFSQSITPDDLDKIDNRLEKRLEKYYPQLAERFLSSDSNRSLGQLILHELIDFLDQRLEMEDVIGLILKQDPDGSLTLRQLHAQAKPDIMLQYENQPEEATFLLLPDTPAGKTLGEAARHLFHGIQIIPVAKSDEVIMYRTLVGIQLEQLQVLNEAGQQAYQTAQAIEHFTTHARQDVQNWQVPVTV
jgi:serine/threonine protein kinase